MADNLPTKEELLAELKRRAVIFPVTAEELAREFANENSLFLRVMGQSAMNLQDSTAMLVGANLLSEEGWRQTIQQQGIIIGRAASIEEILDLIREGLEHVENSKTTVE